VASEPALDAEMIEVSIDPPIRMHTHYTANITSILAGKESDGKPPRSATLLRSS
jgi:hypothetical protein